jgi:hypothetical protein
MKDELYLYFIADKRRQKVKIGISNNPWYRLSQFQAGCPVKLKLLKAIPGATRHLEEAIHCGFSALWSHGEWFDLGNEIWDFMEECAAADDIAGVVDAWGFQRVYYTDERGNSLSKYDWMASQSDCALQ